jgi:hypothetical protein
MPFCSNCGSQLKDSDSFCGNCGKRVQKPSSVQEEDNQPLFSRLKKLSGEAVDLSSSLGSSIKERVKEFDGIPTIDQVSERVLGDRKDDFMPDSFWSSTKLEEFKRVLAWIVNTNTSALVDLTNAILPYMHSHIIIDGDTIRISEEGGLAVIDSLLFNLNYITIIGRDTITNFGIVPKSINIPEGNFDSLNEKFESFVTAFNNTKDAAKALQDASRPLLEYGSDLGRLCRKEDVTDVKKLGKYNRAKKKFQSNLEKIDFKQYNQMNYQKYLDAGNGKHIVSALDVDTSYGEFLFYYSFYIHEGLKTDPERYIAPFFHSLESLDQLYIDTMKLFEECDSRSGILSRPPADLKEKALNSLNDFSTSYLAINSSHHVSSSSFHRSNMVDNWKNSIRKQLQRRRDHRKLVEDIYELIYSANLVQPVLRIISPY